MRFYFNELNKNEYEEIYLKMTSSKIPVNIFDAKFLDNEAFATIKYVARKYKSSIRLIFTDVLGLHKIKVKKQSPKTPKNSSQNLGELSKMSKYFLTTEYLKL